MTARASRLNSSACSFVTLNLTFFSGPIQGGVVTANTSLALLHLVSAPKGAKNSQANSRRRRSEQRRNGPKKRNNAPKAEVKSSVATNSKACPECGGTMVDRDGPNTNICRICRHEWR